MKTQIGSLEVVNIKQVKQITEEHVYIGRKNSYYNVQASALANPYHVGKDGDRDKVILKYRYWLWELVQNKESEQMEELVRIANMVREGKNVKLMCYCKPLACHGDVVKRAVEWLLK